MKGDDNREGGTGSLDRRGSRLDSKTINLVKAGKNRTGWDGCIKIGKTRHGGKELMSTIRGGLEKTM